MDQEFESIQLALFTREPPALDAMKFWDKIFGTSPAGFQTVGPGHTQAQGLVGGLSITVIVQINRFDIVMQAPLPKPPIAPPSPIPDIQATIAAGHAYVGKVVANLTVARVATVIQGNYFATSRIDAVAKFRQVYPDCKLPSAATAVTYEFAVPTPSRLKSDRRLIRLCKWQTVQAKFVNVGPEAMNVTDKFSLHSYVDVSMETVELLSETDAAAALQEVADEALSIAHGGSDIAA